MTSGWALLAFSIQGTTVNQTLYQLLQM